MAQDKATIIKQAQRFTAKGQIDKAIQEWEKVLEINPKDGNIHNTVGDLLLKKNDPEKAATFYFKAANLFRDQGFSMKAMALYKKILNIHPKSTDALVGLAEMNAERGLVGNANEIYLTAAEIFVKSDSVDRAMELYEKIMALSPGSLALHQRIADLYAKIGLSGEAARVYVRCAAAYLEKGDADKARPLYQKVAETVPSDPAGHIGLGTVLASQGHGDEALRLLDKAAERIPASEAILMARASVALDLDRLEEAATSVESVLSKDSSNVAALTLLVRLHAKARRYEEAWEVLERAVELCLNADMDEEAQGILALADQIPGREEDALRLYVQVHRQAGREEEAIQTLKALAESLSSRGDNAGARGALEDAAALAPDDQDIARRIDEISGPVGETLELDVSGIDLDGPPDSGEDEVSADAYVKSLEEQLTGSSDGSIEDFQSIDLGGGEEEEEAEEDPSGTYVIPETDLDVSILKEEPLEDSDEETPEGMDDDDIIIDINRVDDEAPPPPDLHPQTASVDRSPDRFDEDLAEGDFYLEQGLKEEAIEIFQNLNRQYPDRPEPAERLAALLRPKAEAPVMKVRPAQKTDAKAFLESLKDVPDDAEGVGQKAKDEMDSIFDAFKKGVEHEVEEGDFETHYNLGIAYKEMGLVEDAIREFEIALRVQRDSVQGRSMLAMCYMEGGQPVKALEEYRSLESVVGVNDDRYLSLQYDLAVAAEAAGDSAEALAIFKGIQQKAGSFKDVSQRIVKLRG